jgi:hypothetical protein
MPKNRMPKMPKVNVFYPMLEFDWGILNDI